MKNYLQLRKEELKKRGAKGFTLMEMLIVVAIIAVLIAIAIPIFTSQLEQSRESTDKGNLRSAYAELAAEYLTNGGSANSITVPVNQRQEGWQQDGGSATTKIGADLEMSGVSHGGIDVSAKTDGSYTLTITTSGEISAAN
jgi:type IV pilus assembly protein PilA